MGVKFLGQYLVDERYISDEELRAALEEHEAGRLGRIAVAKGLLLQSELEEILTQQQQVDLRIGDLAVQNRMITQEQREQLLTLQQRARRRLGEVLVDRGSISAEAFQRALADFERSQAAFTIDAEYLPPQHAGRTDMLTMIDMTQKVLIRVCELPAKIEAAVPYCGPANAYPFSVAIPLTGADSNARFMLCAARPMAARLHAILNDRATTDATEEELWCALGEVCSCIVGAAASALASMGSGLALRAPIPLHDTSHAAASPIENGVRWNIHTPQGMAVGLME